MNTEMIPMWWCLPAMMIAGFIGFVYGASKYDGHWCAVGRHYFAQWKPCPLCMGEMVDEYKQAASERDQACVNACAEIPTSALRNLGAGELRAALRALGFHWEGCEQHDEPHPIVDAMVKHLKEAR